MIKKGKKVLLVEDFNCKGINWKEMEGRGGSWSEEMLQIAMENTLDQWVEEFTRLREEPSVLDLVFSKKLELCPIIKSLCPVNKGDHVLIEIELQEWDMVRKEEHYKNGRLSYARKYRLERDYEW